VTVRGASGHGLLVDGGTPTVERWRFEENRFSGVRVWGDGTDGGISVHDAGSSAEIRDRRSGD
jgi:hypothetical protein